MTLGDNILDAHQSGSDVDRVVLTESVARIDAAYSNAAITIQADLGEDWAKLMIGYTRLGLVFYLAEMGSADLGEAFAEVVNDVNSQPDVHHVPTDEVAVLVEGDMNIYDPAFREQAPELAKLIDEALANEGLAPFDVDVVDGVGISEREPCDLSATRPYTEQSLSQADLNLIADLALLIAAGDAAENTLQALTWMELEAMLGAASGIVRDPDSYSPEQVAGIPRLQDLVRSEIDTRHTEQDSTI